ncbi:MAG TPA: alpha/beta fold hydrolase [Candidatus Eisenbacteria bacterium]|nr:alpha/beta fold hydrolase [Candidatus Eisenbacteria bacterium]
MKRLLAAALAAALAILAILAALGWHVSGRIYREALLAAYDHGPSRYDDARVDAVDSTRITLTPLRNERGRVGREGAWGLFGAAGGGRVGAILGRDGARVVRAFTPIDGLPEPGDSVDIRLEAYQGDPLRARGLAYDDVTVPTELGPAPAWRIPGARGTWAVFVHGKGAARRQALRALGVVHALGFPALVITYRNDEGAPPSPDGRYHYGLTEWRDVEAAVRYALANGARDVVLIGTSMGGGIVAAFLERSPLASRVSRAVLDSPMLDFGETIDWGVAHATLPGTRIPMPGVAGSVGKQFAAWRYGVDWKALDLKRGADAIAAPLLVFHGDADEIVPIATSRALAARRPDRVTFVAFHGAHHAEGWNVDSLRFQAALRDFLSESP